jgi:hypothetical protein
MKGYRTPEEAAIAGYPKAAHARATKVRRLGPIPELQAGVRATTDGKFSGEGQWVEVHIDTEPSHPGKVKCFEEGGQWYEWGSVF